MEGGALGSSTAQAEPATFCPGVSLPKGGGRAGGGSRLDLPFLALGDLIGQPCGLGTAQEKWLRLLGLEGGE